MIAIATCAAILSELQRRQAYILRWQVHGATVLACDFWGRPVAVSIDGQSQWSNVSLSHAFPDVTELRKLSISHVRMSINDMRWIGSQGHLRYLSLEGCSLPEGSLLQINSLNELQLINLSYTNIRNEDLCHLGTMQDLTAILLDGTKVNTSGIRCLRNLPRLQFLSLCGTSVSDDAVPLLRRFSSLRVLRVRQTMISAQGQRDLAQSMPYVRFKSVSDMLNRRRPREEKKKPMSEAERGAATEQTSKD